MRITIYAELKLISQVQERTKSLSQRFSCNEKKTKAKCISSQVQIYVVKSFKVHVEINLFYYFV